MNAPQRKTQPRWTRRKEARPDEIIAAALELFTERGFAATRLDDVATHAGVSKGTLYLYFENKEDLFKAVVRANIVPLLEYGEELIQTFPGSNAELLALLVRGWWEKTGSSKVSGLPKLIISEAGNFPDIAKFYYGEVIQRAQSLFRRLLQRGMDAGEFRPIDVEQFVQIAVAPLIMLAVWRHSFACCGAEELKPQRYLDSYLDMLLHSLEAAFVKEKKHGRRKD